MLAGHGTGWAAQALKGTDLAVVNSKTHRAGRGGGRGGGIWELLLYEMPVSRLVLL